MVTDFEDRLRQIREAKHRESEQQKQHDSAVTLERQAELASRFDRREQVEKAIATYGDKFMALVPTFTRQKSFFEGMYKIEVHSDEMFVADSGKVVKHFSRVTFLIDTQSTDGRIVVRTKKTSRNRDLESSSYVVEPGEESLEGFKRFAEDQYIEFAGAYFSGSTPVAQPR